MTFSGFWDFRQPTGGSSGGLTQGQINIIEQNLDTQIDMPVGYTEIEWANGVPTNVKKYISSDKATMLYNVDITWVDGVPVTVTSVNLDEGITTTTSISWDGGVPININKT